VSSSQTGDHHTHSKEASNTERSEDVFHNCGVSVVSSEVEQKDKEGDDERESEVKVFVEFLGDVKALEEGVVASQGSSNNTKYKNSSSDDKRLNIEFWNSVEGILGQTSSSKSGSHTNEQTRDDELDDTSSSKEKLCRFERLNVSVFDFVEAIHGGNKSRGEKHTSYKA